MPETLLHTDLLEKQFGPTHILVNCHDNRHRIVDIVNSEGVCLTHAVTWLTPIDYRSGSKFSRAALEIRAGGSLGKTFRNH